MKIELKKIKVFNSLSEETTAFTADVYVDGVKCAYARNDGRGGCTNYNRYENKMELLRHAEAFCKTLPSKKYDFGEFEMNLETFIDDALYEHIKSKEDEKFTKKINKLCETNIVYGNLSSNTVYKIGFKGSPKLDDIKKTEYGRMQLKTLLQKTSKELKEGEIIFNKNLDNL